uniref:Uncharacterized protein n=1 Tax=Arundo donax TaxID=35708 RepID=A0A0A8XWH8_ARUDO
MVNRIELHISDKKPKVLSLGVRRAESRI